VQDEALMKKLTGAILRREQFKPQERGTSLGPKAACTAPLRQPVARVVDLLAALHRDQGRAGQKDRRGH